MEKGTPDVGGNPFPHDTLCSGICMEYEYMYENAIN